MLLRNEIQKPQIQKRIKVLWGLEELETLQKKKVLVLRGLHFDWVKKLFFFDSTQGRRLWFELFSFEPIELQSPFFELKKAETADCSFLQYFHVNSIVNYSDYLSLLDGLADQLSSLGYTCYKHVLTSDELTFQFGSSANGGGFVSKPIVVDSFSKQLPESNTSILLDEFPNSLLVFAKQSKLEEAYYGSEELR